MFNIKDVYIPKKMYLTGKNFSEDEIKIFLQWTKEIYGSDIESTSGYFLDIGANIGTTCVYIGKRYPNIQCIAFEPDDENFRVLNANVKLNKLDNVITVNAGLSNKVQQGKMRQFDDNRGRNYIVYDDSPRQQYDDFEKIEITTLDTFITKHEIRAEDIGFIWMDTEGFEPFVLDGAKALFRKKKIPMWMEFCGETIRNHDGSFELLRENLKMSYEKFRYIDKNGNVQNLSVDSLDYLLKDDNNYRGVL